MGSGSVQIYSWYFDTRDGELEVGTAARLLNYGSLCSGYGAGDVDDGGDGFRRRGCVLKVGWMRDYGSHYCASW